MKFKSINDVTLHFSDSGLPDGPVLVFINSLGTDFRVWDAVYRDFEAKFRVIRYDKRGHGLSGAPAAPYRMDDHVNDLIGLLDFLDVTDATLCGVSVGGLIAQGVIARCPERVRALVLCDTAAKIGNDQLWNERIQLVQNQGVEAIADGILTRWFTEAFRSQCVDRLDGWRNMLIRTPAAGYAGTSAAIRDTDFTDSTSEIEVPALVLCGDQDGATPPDVTRELAELIEDSRYILIHDAGHLPSIEQPQVVIDSMREFFEEKNIVG